MALSRAWLRGIAMLFGLALLAGVGSPARAIEPYPGETREAFVARSALEQQRKLAEADAASQALGGGFAGSSSASGGGGFKFGMFGLVALVLGGLRLSRGIFRASRAITGTGGVARRSESFEDRLAEKLRELERATPSQPHAPALPQMPAIPVSTQSPADAPPRPAPGPRTFGRRVS